MASNKKSHISIASQSHRPIVALSSLTEGLPPLPPIVRYYCDYFDKVFSLKNLDATDEWLLALPNSEKTKVSFQAFDPNTKAVLKSWAAWALTSLAPATVSSYLTNFTSHHKDLSGIFDEFSQGPFATRDFWQHQLSGYNFHASMVSALRSVLIFFCENGISGWNSGHRHFVSTFTYTRQLRRYPQVRDGSSFLSAPEQAAIADYFYTLVDELDNKPSLISNRDLRAACLLYWAFAHGVRPIQLANRDIDDVKIWNTKDEVSVHLRFQFAKQRGRARANSQVRSMKRDWASLMVAYVERRSNFPTSFLTEDERENSLFGLGPTAVRANIARLMFKITGVKRRPYDLRHTAAQRNVDAGMSSLELAEFLMHRSVNTGQVYYECSPTQADRINKALGLSPVYGELASAITSRTIDKRKLLGMPDDCQVGAAPHGFAIAGIGACSIGQSLCTKNPALSCYTCPKFLALADIEIHESVRQVFQKIVWQFVDAEAAETGQPAFTQLRTALEAVDEIISELSAYKQGTRE